MNDRQRLEMVKEYVNTIEFNIDKLNKIMFKRCTGRTTREVVNICDHILSNKNVTRMFVFSNNKNISITYLHKVLNVFKALDVDIDRHTSDTIQFTRLLDNKNVTVEFKSVSEIEGMDGRWLYEKFCGIRDAGVSIFVTHEIDDINDHVFNSLREFIEINGGKII